MEKDTISKQKGQAQQDILYGSYTEKGNIIIAETDKLDNHWLGVNGSPLLTEVELDKALREPRHAKELQHLEQQFTYYCRAKEVARCLEGIVIYTMKKSRQLDKLVGWWASAEEVETAVNIVLMQIDDISRRTATATGLAKTIDHFGCCQSVTDDGLLVISPNNVLQTESGNLYTLTKKTAKVLDYSRGLGKGYAIALQKYIEATKLNVPFMLRFIENAVETLKLQNVAEKYTDRPQIELLKEPPKELLDGRPLLYEQYRLLKTYKELEPSPIATMNANKILYPEDEEK